MFYIKLPVLYHVFSMRNFDLSESVWHRACCLQQKVQTH